MKIILPREKTNTDKQYNIDHPYGRNKTRFQTHPHHLRTALR